MTGPTTPLAPGSISLRLYPHDLSAVDLLVVMRDQAARGVEAGYDGVMVSEHHADFGGYPTWLKDTVRNQSHMNEASLDVYKWVTVYEVYDFESDRYYHVLEDIEEPLFEGELPYRYIRNPFVMVTFSTVTVDRLQ